MSVVKRIKGTVVSSHPLLEDWDEADCLCQAKVPENKKTYLQVWVYDEKRKKHRWKSLESYHQDCPIHGCDPETVAAYRQQRKERKCPED